MSLAQRPVTWLLAAPLAWGAQIGLVWWMDARRCAGELTVSATRTANAAIAVVALLITVWALRRGLALRREANGAHSYLSSGAALVGVVFAIAALIGALGGITLPLCEITR